MGDQQKLNEFEPASREAWLKLVVRDLAGAPFEKKLVKRVGGVQIAPLYDAEQAQHYTGLPGFAPYTRGSFALGASEMGWDVRPEIAHANPADAARAILDDLNGGATSVALKLDRASRAGTPERGIDGIALGGLADLAQVLTHVALERVPVSLEGGALSVPVALGLVALAKRRKVPLTALHGAFGVDPLGTLAAYGSLPSSLEHALAEAARFARYAHESTPEMRAITVNTSPYHDAGADAVTEVAISLATGVEYLRALTQGGLDVSAAAEQLLFQFSIGRDFFMEIAKLRAARLTWSKVVRASGGGADAQAMVMHARTSLRTKTQRDPWVNLLRATAESFAAAVGGADTITTGGFDEVLGESDDFARRLARNTQHLLRHESNVHRVVDSAGGSFYVEAITHEIAQKAWEKLQTIEKAGGLAKALTGGSLQRELAAQLDADRKAVESRKIAITGVNEFPNVKEAPVVRAHGKVAPAPALKGKLAAIAHDESLVEAALKALEAGHSFAALAEALGHGRTPQKGNALMQQRLSEPFESLRDAADRYLQEHGTRPRVFLANLGPIPEHKARATFAQNFFEAGGFEVLTNDGFADAEGAARAFAASSAEIACLCSSDTLYAELAGAAAKALATHAPKALVLAGSPGDKEASYRESGLTDFIFAGMNAYASLRSLLERVGAV
jgi:methylmalonyl-CoA mutase